MDLTFTGAVSEGMYIYIIEHYMQYRKHYSYIQSGKCEIVYKYISERNTLGWGTMLAIWR